MCYEEFLLNASTALYNSDLTGKTFFSYVWIYILHL